MEEMKNMLENIAEEPKEKYTFRYTEEKLKVLKRRNRFRVVKRITIITVWYALLLLYLTWWLQDAFWVSVCLSVWACLMVQEIGKLFAARKNQKKNESFWLNAVFDYEVYGDCVIFSVFAEDEVLHRKVRFDEINEVRPFADTMVSVTADGVMWCLDKDSLAEDSIFLKKLNEKKRRRARKQK